MIWKRFSFPLQDIYDIFMYYFIDMKHMTEKYLQSLFVQLIVIYGLSVSVPSPAAPLQPPSDPYSGITTEGGLVKGLYSVKSTGVSTEPMRMATEQFLDSLTAEQRDGALFPVNDPEWRIWTNIHAGERQGVGFLEMSEQQKLLAFDMLRAALSAKGFETTRDIMRLNQHLAELLSNFEAYGEGRYWLTFMGKPSETEPWGWQLEGHHLIINFFVLADQVVMTPTFMGSEPVIAESGKYKGTAVLEEEQDKGLGFIRSLNEQQRSNARIDYNHFGNNRAEAKKDNIRLPYAGIPVNELNPPQQTRLLELINEFVGRMDDGHAAIKMDEIGQHLSETWFAWSGDIDEKKVFYYRIHSPVVLIEFDHQRPVALRSHEKGGRKNHIHTVIRTPNGNDYGKDLLRQHYDAHRDNLDHGHQLTGN